MNSIKTPFKVNSQAEKIREKLNEKRNILHFNIARNSWIHEIFLLFKKRL